MKDIKAFTILSLVMLLPLHAEAQITDWIVNQIVEQVVGNIVDNIAESAGRSAASSTVGLYSNTTSKTSTNFTNYKSNVGSRSRGDAFLGMNKDAKSYKMSLLDADVNEIYKGLYFDKNVQQAICDWARNNKMSIDTLMDLSKNRDKYQQLLNLRNLIGDKSYSVWLDQPGASDKLTKIIDDLSCNVRLLTLLSSHPQSVKNYAKFMCSPLRRDHTFMYYISRQADCLEYMWDSLCNKAPHVIARDLKAEYEHDKTLLLSYDEKKYGTVCKNESGMYDLMCIDPALLDLYPIGNANIHYDNVVWQTDNMGRPIKAILSLPSLLSAGKKDKQKNKFLLTLKTSHAALGVPDAPAVNKKYVDFNLVPLDYGNYCNLINFVPLTKSATKSTGLKKIEKSIKKAIKKGVPVTREVFVDYGQNNSLIPETVSVRVSIGELIDSCLIKNN